MQLYTVPIPITDADTVTYVVSASATVTSTILIAIIRTVTGAKATSHFVAPALYLAR